MVEQNFKILKVYNVMIWCMYTLWKDLLHRMVIIFLIFWRTTIMFSTAAAPFYTLTNSAQKFPFFHIFTNTFWGFFFFLIAAILMSVRYAHSLKLSKPHALHNKMWTEVMCVIPGLTLWQPIHFALTWWWDEASVSRGPWVNGWAEPLAHTFWAQLRLWHSLSSFEDVATRLCSPPLIVVANTITSAALIIKL